MVSKFGLWIILSFILALGISSELYNFATNTVPNLKRGNTEYIIQATIATILVIVVYVLAVYGGLQICK